MWVQTGACTVGVYQALSLPPLKKGPGDEANQLGPPIINTRPWIYDFKTMCIILTYSVPIDCGYCTFLPVFGVNIWAHTIQVRRMDGH